MSLNYKKTLQDKKLKATSARLAILSILASQHHPFSIPDIISLLIKKSQSADKVTVYRTMASLEESGLIKRVMLKKRQAYYELNEPHEHHHHLTCQECGVVVDIPGCQVKIEPSKLLRGTNFARVTDHSLEFTGLCKKCAS